MSEAFFLSLFILIMTVGLSLLIYWSGPRFAGWGKTRTYLTSGGFLVGGIIAGIYSYQVTEAIDSRTLFEARVEGNLSARAGDPIVTRHMYFEVKHPGTRHQLSIHPRLAFAQMATFTPELTVRLWDRPDKRMIDQNIRFEPQQNVRYDRDGNRRVDYEWDAVIMSFEPSESGLHSLEIDFLIAETPDLYIRIEDPLKTDGSRNPGLR